MIMSRSREPTSHLVEQKSFSRNYLFASQLTFPMWEMFSPVHSHSNAFKEHLNSNASKTISLRIALPLHRTLKLKNNLGPAGTFFSQLRTEECVTLRLIRFICREQFPPLPDDQHKIGSFFLQRTYFVGPYLTSLSLIVPCLSFLFISLLPSFSLF